MAGDSKKSILELSKSKANAKFMSMVKPLDYSGKTIRPKASPKTSSSPKTSGSALLKARDSDKEARVKKNFGLSLAEYEHLANTNPAKLFELNERILLKK